VPDGFDRRPATGDRPPARRTTARQQDQAADYDADPYDDPYQDEADDYPDFDTGDRGDYAGGYDDEGFGEPVDAPQRKGPVRRLRNWLGFPAPGQTDEDADFYRRQDESGEDTGDDPAVPAIPPQPSEPPPPPGVLRAKSAAGPARRRGGTGEPDDGETPDGPGTLGSVLGERPAADRPRRARATSPWEDIMLGSGPPPGTPMSDALPADTLPPDSLPLRPPAPADPETARPPRGKQPSRGAGALSDWLDPVDPVDPLDPRDPTGEADDSPEAPASRPESDETTSGTGAFVAPTFEGADNTGQTVIAPIPAPARGDERRAGAPPAAASETPPEREDFPAEGPEPRRMLRLLPSPVLADGGGMVVDGGRVGRLTVRAAAVRGDLHSQQGTPRQNTFAVGPDPSGKWTITLVCDGVDGAYAPELAAQVAVRSAYRAIARMVAAGRHEDWDWTTTLASVQTELRARLGEISARARGLGRPAPATRLAVLVTSAEPLQDDRVDMAVLGDSTILRLAEGGWRAPLGIREISPDTPVPALPEHGTEHVRVCRTTWRPSDALVVMTGGFAESLGAASGGLAARLADDWRRPPELMDFLRDVAQGSHTDDGAVVALWPEP
jgi:hypothetical protein